MTTNQIRLEDFVTGWNAVADAHRDSDPKRWALCHEFASLHVEALNAIARQSGAKQSPSDAAVLLLGVHAFNLYTALIGLVVRGQFDVASHLYRGLGDSGGLIYATGNHSDLAERWHSGELKASTARKQLEADLRASDAIDAADVIKNRFLDDFGAMNDLAHVKNIHADKLVHRENGLTIPAVGGHRDDGQYAEMVLGVLDQERWCLTFMSAVRRSALPEEWRARFTQASQLYTTLLTPLDE